MRIQILDAAVADLKRGAMFYERQRPGLGKYFLDELSESMDALQELAGIHSLHFGCHRMLAKRFPYAIYHRIESAVVRIYAILDCRRDPAWTKSHIEKVGMEE